MNATPLAIVSCMAAGTTVAAKSPPAFVELAELPAVPTPGNVEIARVSARSTSAGCWICVTPSVLSGTHIGTACRLIELPPRRLAGDRYGRRRVEIAEQLQH